MGTFDMFDIQMVSICDPIIFTAHSQHVGTIIRRYLSCITYGVHLYLVFILAAMWKLNLWMTLK